MLIVVLQRLQVSFQFLNLPYPTLIRGLRIQIEQRPTLWTRTWI